MSIISALRPASILSKRLILLLPLAALSLSEALVAQGPVTGSWNVNANGNWSATGSWLGGVIPNGVDHIANFTNEISTTRTATIDAGISGSTVTLGTLNIGDLSGGSSFVIAGGTLTFDVSSGTAQINKINDGGNDTISSALVINDQLDVSVNDPTHNQGLILSGVISGGMGAGNTTLTFNDLSAGNTLNWLLLSGANTFTGQVLVQSGLLRYETSNAAAGAVGVGNETVVTSGGSVDLRDRDFNIGGVDDTEIFMLGGFGTNGVGALRNTTGTASLSHLIVTSDTMVGGYNTIDLIRHTDSSTTAEVAPILDLGGNAFSKIGTNEFRIRNADILNKTGAVINVFESELRFENNGALVGGALIGGTTYGNDLSGLVINVAYNKNPYDGVNPANGTRSFDPWNPPATHTGLTGNSIADARLSFGTYLAATAGHVTEDYDNVTIHLNHGIFQREGNSGVGQTFDQVFGPNTVINIVGGGIGGGGISGYGNAFDIQSGSASFNAAFNDWEHPGVTEFQGRFDNTSAGNLGTGFTVRGGREMRVTGANPDFDGDILVKQSTGRQFALGLSTTSGTAVERFWNLTLAGPDGAFANAATVTLDRWGSLALLNNSASPGGGAAANNNNRLNDGGMFDMRNGILHLETHATTTNTENVGNLKATYGSNWITLDTRAGGNFNGSAASVTLTNGGVLRIWNTNNAKTFGGAGADVSLQISGVAPATIGGALGTNQAAVLPGIFGGSLPNVSAPTIGSYTRELIGVQDAVAWRGAGIGLMTLEGGYLRPLQASEYFIGGTPAADVNWWVDQPIGPNSANDRLNYSSRNVTGDIAVNSLSVNVSNPSLLNTSEKDYVLIDHGATLTINSGIINFASFVESNNINTSAWIRGGHLNLNGQPAVINSSNSWQDLDRNTANWYEYLTGNNSYISSHIVNATGLIKTGANTLYLNAANSISGNIYVGDQGSLVARHHLALGAGAPGREIWLSGSASFLMEYGTDISGIDVRVKTIAGSQYAVRNEGTSHSTFRGNVILDYADQTGSTEFASTTLTARNNGTLSLYGNVFTDNNANLSDSDSFNDPPLVSTSFGETYTVNLFGQFRDVVTGHVGTAPGNELITSVFRTGDSATRLDSNHSLRFQMSGHDESNVNAFQQWNATGRVDLRQGYFRIHYDPSAPGNDGTGFLTDGARALITTNDYHNRVVLGADGTSTTNAYHSHLFLTRPGQVLNHPYLYAYNDNRNGTLTIGGENESGSVFYGSIDNSLPFSLQFANQTTERDVRFLQTRGGTMVFNGRFDDENSTADSFNAAVSSVGPGMVIINRNAIGNSDIDRWNFLAGETHWAAMSANNQFARTRGTGTNGIASVSGWGGGGLVLDAQGTARTQTLDGNIFLLGGASYVNTQQNTTFTMGAASPARTLDRRVGSSLAFLEDGNGSINITAAGLSTTAGEFLGTWALYGSAASGITNWAARQGTTGVQAFTGYTADAFSSGTHTNITMDATLGGNMETETVRFNAAANLDIGSSNSLTLKQGGVLIPSSINGAVSITGGVLTSGWTGGGGDLMFVNAGTGTASVSATIADNGSGKVNFVHSGAGTTVLSGANTFSGDMFLNGGVVSISSETHLGAFNGSVVRLTRVNNGGNSSSTSSAVYSAGTNVPLVFTTSVAPGTAAVGTFDASTTTVIGTALASGGSGYTSGVWVDADDSTKATENKAGIWAVFDSGNLHFNGGTLQVTDNVQLNGGRTIWLGGNGGTLDVAAGKALTIDGYITSEFSHVTAANGYVASNQIGGADEQASNRNPDLGDLTIQGGGSVIVRSAPDGTARANLYHSYGGITRIDDGYLRLNSAGSGGYGVLGTNRSWVDGTIIGANGTLELAMLSDLSLYEWLTVRGQGKNGAGSIRTVGTARSYSLTGQIELESDLLVQMLNASNMYLNNGGGDIFGSGNIIRKGGGEFRFYGHNPEWSGALNNGDGTVQFLSAGRVPKMSAMNLTRQSFVILNTGSTTVDDFRDRLPDGLPINASSYSRLRVDTSGIFAGVERTGILTVVNGGQAGVEFNLNSDIVGGAARLTGDYAGWHFADIVRTAGTTVNVRNLDAGTDFADVAFNPTVAGPANNNRAILQVTNLPVTVGAGDGTNGDAPVIPGFFGGTRPAWFTATTGQRFGEEYTASRLMTVEQNALGQNLIRPLKDSEYKTVTNPDTAQTTSVSLEDQGLTGNENVRMVGVDTDTGLSAGLLTNRRNSILTLGSSEGVNSLSFESVSYVDASTNPSGRGNFTTLTMEDGAELTINSGMIVMSNIGYANWAGLAENTGLNIDIRSTIQGGKVNMAGGEAIFSINGLWVHYNTNDNAGYFDVADVDNNYLWMASSITNATNIVKTGAASLFLTAPNYNTGNIYTNQGYIYARHDQSLGAATEVHVTGFGAFSPGWGARIEGVDLVVNDIAGNQTVLQLEEGAYWGGNVIINNVDAASSGGTYQRNFTPRIFGNYSGLSTLAGNITTGLPIASGVAQTQPRMFTTYTGAAGLFDIRGTVMDTAAGAVPGPVTDANLNQLLRMEVTANNHEMTVQLNQPYDAAGRISLVQGMLRFNGGGDFYTAAAASAIASNPNHPMVGLQMGGRSVASTDGGADDDLAFFLANPGNVFNIPSWQVGVESHDPENLTGNDNYNRGNITGNSTIGGENRSGEVTFGTGAGTILFTDMTRTGAGFNNYTRDLRLHAAAGGEVTFRANLADGGANVSSSITKIGAGTVNLQGSSAGEGSVEGVNILGGVLNFNNYGVNNDRRVASGAALRMGGGTLVVDGSTGTPNETFGAIAVNAGGNGIAAVGAAVINLNGAVTRNAGGTVHFQSIAGGVINADGLAASSRIGSFATFGANLVASPFATDWAATDASGQVVAFTGYSVDGFGAGLYTDVQGADLSGAATGSLRFNDASGTITSGALSLGDGGLLVTSNHLGGAIIGPGVELTTSGGDLLIHNFASGNVTLAGDISGSQRVVVGGTGMLTITGTNTYTGATHVTGSATLVVDGAARLGATSGINVNGGRIQYSAVGATSTFAAPFTLGSSGGIIDVADAGSTLVLRHTGANQFTGEANPVSAITSGNPFSGGITFTGPGKIQLGDRSAAANVTDLAGLNSNYTGLTVIGDGVNLSRFTIAGQPNENVNISPFGTTYGWADGTIVRNGVTLEFASRLGGTSHDGQFRLAEWIQFGESVTDNIRMENNTQRNPTLDGLVNVVGALTIHSQNAGYADAGGTASGEVLMNPNAGSLYGTGDIIKTGNGNLRFYRPLHTWTGDLDLRDGFTGLQANNGAFFESTGKIYFGETAANENPDNSSIQLRIENRAFGNATVSNDSPNQDITINREIIVRDGLAHQVTIAAGYMPRNPTIHFTRDMNLGSGSTFGGAAGTDQIRFYFEDTAPLDGTLVGHQQQSVFDVTGALSGSNNLRIETQEDTGANNDFDQFFTVHLRGDNSAFTGKITVGVETGIGTNNFDRDDLEILRLGNSKALTAANTVELRNLSTLQVGGSDVTIGTLLTNDGTSISGIYSFTSPSWEPGRQTAADLDATAGQFISPTTGLITATDYTPRGGSSAIIENASATPGVLRITQNGDGVWDAYFRDGVPAAQFENKNAAPGSLSLEKLGTGTAALTIFNDYTGTTTVTAGGLQVGQGGDGSWTQLSQGAVTITTSENALKAAGSTGTGATFVGPAGTLSGSGHVRSNLTVAGTLAPGDASGTLGAGGQTGTLFIGGPGGVGDLTMQSNAALLLQITASTNIDSDLNSGAYTIEMGAAYENYISSLPGNANYLDTAVNPTTFGQLGTEIYSGAHDHVEIGGKLTWNGGTIQVSNTSDYMPIAGDIFNLADWYGVADWGSFDAGSNRYVVGNGDDNGDINLPDLSMFGDDALRWDTGLWTSHGILIVAIAPEPSRAVLLLLGMLAVGMRRRRRM